jgi:hypothetical protein
VLVGGTADYLAKYTNETTFEDSIIYDDGSNIGINTNTPKDDLQIGNRLVLSDHAGNGDIMYNAYYNGSTWLRVDDEDSATLFQMQVPGDQQVAFYTATDGVSTADTEITWSQMLSLSQTRINVPTLLSVSDTTPDALFEVSASGGADDLFFLSSTDDTDGDILTVLNSGNIGIGNSAPNSTLDVSGDINISLSGSALYFPDGTSQTTAATTSGNVSSVAGVGATTNLSYWINSTSLGSSAIYDDGSGDIGIGTESPADKLHVQGGDLRIDGTNKLKLWGDTTTAASTLQMYIESKYGKAHIHTQMSASQNSGPALDIYTGNAYSAARSSGDLSLFSGDLSGVLEGFLVESGNVLLYTGSHNGHPNASTGDVFIYTGEPSSGYTRGNIILGHDGSALAGNVGIGNTDPNSTLDVSGDINISLSGSALYFPDGTSQTTAGSGNVSSVAGVGATTNLSYWINSTSLGSTSIYQNGTNIGINTNASSYPLLISGISDSSARGPLYVSTPNADGYGAALTLDSTGDSGEIYSFFSTGAGSSGGAGDFAVYTPGSYVFRVNSNGQYIAAVNFYDYLGQITAVPSSSSTKGIVVRGASSQSADLIQWQNSSGDVLGVVDATGNVGIGDETPDASLLLDVEGAVGATEYCDEAGANCFDYTNITALNGNISTSTGEGTANVLAKFTSAGVLEDSKVFDDGTFTGINETSPDDTLDVVGSLEVQDSSGDTALKVNDGGDIVISLSAD